jgi:hypothetical protein
VRFAHIAAGNTFTTAEIHPAVIEALGPERVNDFETPFVMRLASKRV